MASSAQPEYMKFLDPSGRPIFQIDSLLLEASNLYNLDASLGNATEGDERNLITALTLKGLGNHRDRPLLLLLLANLAQHATLAASVSKLGDELASLRKEVSAPKAEPPASDPQIVQKLDTLIGRTSFPPTPQAPQRPTPPAKPAQPRATPTHAQVVRATPNPPTPPTKKAAKATSAQASGSATKAKLLWRHGTSGNKPWWSEEKCGRTR